MFRAGVDRDSRITTHGFLIAVEIADDVSLTYVTEKLADATSWIEGVGKSEVDHLGPIEVIEEENVTT